MANEQSNDAQPGHDTSSNTAFEDQDTRDGHESTFTGAADSTSSSAPQIEGSVQPSSSSPLWNTREGRIAGYRRMMESDHEPEQRANFAALIKYFENGGKVPEGKEEVWAFDGQASFGIRFYTRRDQMPDGWLYKHKWCDSSK